MRGSFHKKDSSRARYPAMSLFRDQTLYALNNVELTNRRVPANPQIAPKRKTGPEQSDPVIKTIQPEDLRNLSALRRDRRRCGRTSASTTSCQPNANLSTPECLQSAGEIDF